MLSAISKLSSMESFELYIFSLGYSSFDLSTLAGRLVIAAEFLLGAALSTGILFRPAKWLTVLFLSFFSCFLMWRAAVGDMDSCHCMGDIVDMNPYQSLIKNVLLAALLAYSWKLPPAEIKGKDIFRKGIPAVCSMAVLSAVFIISPPDMFFRRGRISDDLSQEKFSPTADSLGLSDGKRIVCFYSAGCEHCRHCASKMAGIIRRHDIPVDSVSVIFMQTHVNQDSVSIEFFNTHGEGLILPHAHLHPYSFIPMTNGAMPLVVLLEDGKKAVEYDYLSIDESQIAGFYSTRTSDSMEKL